MSGPSRRSVLAGMGGLGLAAALSQSFGWRGYAATPLTDTEFDQLRNRWVDLVTGRNLVDPELPQFDEPLATVDQTADEVLALLVPGEDRSQVFSDQPLDTSAAISGGYTRIARLARAWATPGSRHHQSEEVLSAALAGLFDMHRLAYHAGAVEFGNWWAWEIGASRALSDCMAILRDHIDDNDLVDYCAAIDHFVPDPWFQYIPPRENPRDVIRSTGANRVDLCQAAIVRAIVTGDEPKLAHAVEGLTETWQYVTSGNGFFHDGSFVQHSTIGYTGTYGVVLLGGLSKLFALVANSSHDITDPSRSIIDRAVEESFAPVIFRGQMMDAVRGRAVSREGERSYDNGAGAIEAILRLSQAVDSEMAERWRGLCRQWIDAARTGTGAHDILAGASIVRTALVHDLLTTGPQPLPDAGGPRLFSGMDRLVHRGRDNHWAATVAMCSNRIAWYECGNGENDFGAQTSAGMTYLYLDTDDAHFDDEFWPTSDLTSPVGTTVDTIELPPRVEGQWGNAVPQNEWTGGSTLGEWSLAGQHLIGPGATGLTARKSWFAGPDFLACLGSDVAVIPAGEIPRFDAEADAHTNAGALADDNFATAKTMLVKNSTAPRYSRRTYVRINPDPIAEEIASVTFHFKARVNDSGGSSDVVSVRTCGEFDESTLTWNTQPEPGEVVASVPVSGSYAWYSVDLTETHAAEVAAGEPFSLVLWEEDPGLSVEIRSRETDDGPYLTVELRTDGDEGRTKTVVEHRNTGTRPGRLVVDRHQVVDATMLDEPSWAHLDGVAGYVFLEPATVRASVLPRTGSWSRINTNGSTAEHTRYYATVEVLHNVGSAGTYAYLVLPQASRALTMARAKRPPVEVIANTAAQQAIRHKNLVGINYWQPGTVAGITVDRPASVMLQSADRILTVSDPTQDATSLTVELLDTRWTSATGDGITSELDGDILRIHVDVADRIGMPVEITLT